MNQAKIILMALCGLAGAMTLPVHACGPNTDCAVGERTYRVRMPADHDGIQPVGAIMFMHGWRGSAAGVMLNESLGNTVSDMGLALIAPMASTKEDWTIPGAPIQGDDEIEYIRRVLEDVTARFPIDPDRVMATGFSSGGMMVWNVACALGEKFVGFAPISGTFWAPLPERCTSAPAHVLHVHGTTDKMVPLHGRPIKQTHQGDVYEAIKMYGNSGEFGPTESYEVLDLTCERRRNVAGKVLELCLHSDGHMFREKYVVRAWRELEKLEALRAD